MGHAKLKIIVEREEKYAENEIKEGGIKYVQIYQKENKT
jgi:hypothetical protein